MSPPPFSALLGPPRLHNPHSAAEPSAPTGDRFMDAMVSGFNTATANPTPPMGHTANNSRTFLATGNPCLDFFFHVVPNTPSASITERLYSSWSHNPLTTLKLICNLRGLRGTGKSDKEGFYAAAFWLHTNHPKTFACNVSSFALFGCFKDFPEILYRLLEGLEIRQVQNTEWMSKKNIKLLPKNNGRRGQQPPFYRANKKVKGRTIKSIIPREVRILNEAERARIEKEEASIIRHDKYISLAKKFLEKFTHDPHYRFLYERVSDMFAHHLTADLGSLKANELNKISLAAKWCPSIDSSFDRSTLLCESIARKAFPREKYNEYDGLEDSHYAYRVRDRLRKEVLGPLRKALELPEVYLGAMKLYKDKSIKHDGDRSAEYLEKVKSGKATIASGALPKVCMGANQWGSIPYNRVASVAMKLYKDKFVEHDGDRFAEYLEKVKSGKATIAAGALLPHEIITSLNSFSDGGQVAELQWQRIVDDLSKKGKLKNCLAICDVSESMSGTPMEVCVALGLLVSELSEEPWKGKVITFSQDPKMHLIQGDTLKRKTDFIRRMDWGMNTNFQKVFDLILGIAVNGKLSEEEMIKRVIVFSGMEFDQACTNSGMKFDQACTNSWETDYQVIQRKFKEKGYGSAVPEIVFWNLRESRATPVPSKQEGVALVSGFSKNLLTMFLDNAAEALNPEAFMEAAISGEEYSKLVVLD